MCKTSARSVIWAGFLFLGGLFAVAQDPTDWRALTQKPHAKLPVAPLGLQPLLTRADGSAVNSKEDWQSARKELHEAWLAKLGKSVEKPKSLAARVEGTEKLDGFTRQLVSFHSGGGDRLSAYLLIPDGIKQGEKRPAVVVFHQTTREMHKEPAGVIRDKQLNIGLHLVKRGYVVLCPQCFILKDGWAAAQAKVITQRWPGWTGMGKMTFDASRCVDFLETLEYVDAAKIGCMGHSLGAKETLYALAFETRFKVGVFSEGGIGLRMSNWFDPWYLGGQMKAHVPTFENHQVLALCAPRPFLLVAGDSADGDQSWTFIKAALPVYELLGVGERVGMINHHAKHSFPYEARRLSYRWLDHWLNFRPLCEEVGEK